MDNNYELYENAKKRIRQRKRLYYHFVVFIVGILFLLVLNKILNYGEDSIIPNWSYYVIGIWFFLWCIHFSNVYLFNRFMNKEWELKETDRLIKKQEAKIVDLSKKVEKKFEDQKKALEIELNTSKSDSEKES